METLDRQHLNRTRLECKVDTLLFISVSVVIWIEPDWNVKVPVYTLSWWVVFIWIEPDWNVKDVLDMLYKFVVFIWIEPDWNVKKIKGFVMEDEGYYLNRTRLECKAFKPLIMLLSLNSFE